MRNQRFEACMSKIIRTYSNQEYQMLSGDRFFEHVPDALMRLWYSDEDHSMAVCNMLSYYNRYQDGAIPEPEFDVMLTGLDAALAHEFAILQQPQPQSQSQQIYSAQVCAHATRKTNP